MLFALGATLVASSAIPARATTVEFYTTGTFSCGSIAVGCLAAPPNTISVASGSGTATLDFTQVSPLNPTIANVPPQTNEGLGTITTTSTNSNINADLFNGATFTLSVFQVTPGNTSGNLAATLDGTVKVNQSDLVIDFTHPTLSLDGVMYAIQGGSDGGTGIDVHINPPSVCKLFQGVAFNCGVTSINAEVNSLGGNGGQTPEPELLALTGMGFFALAGIAFRRGRKRTQSEQVAS